MNEALWADLRQLTGEHLLLTGAAVVLAAAMGVPLGIALAWHAKWRRWMLAPVNIVQTIPSLALFGFLIPAIGIGPRTALAALVLYALLPVVRGTLVGVLGVEAAVREAAIAMGMTRWQLLRLVELPLAVPSVLSGLRIATVTTVGTATIAAAIGGGGLGVFIFRGVASVDTAQVLAGAIPAALMALLADGGLGWLEKRLASR